MPPPEDTPEPLPPEELERLLPLELEERPPLEELETRPPPPPPLRFSSVARFGRAMAVAMVANRTTFGICMVSIVLRNARKCGESKLKLMNRMIVRSR